VVVLEAYQNPAGNYAGGSAETSFTVLAAEQPGLALVIPTQTYGEAPFKVAGTSNSTAPITYTVVTGPATISGNMVTVTGAGSVIMQATQPSGGAYLGATVRSTFSVQGKAPVLTLPAIADKVTTSGLFNVTATSTSPGTMFYKVVSGPARVAFLTNGVGTVQLTGAGVVVLEAYQNPAGNYAGGSAETSFTVLAK
jgi:hypothetical protein